ncbi:MAG: replicative DNA helicase [Planctomycetes bacterium]|nr:replicative DNA helicase [Planctomycetota bacterium]
MEELRATGLPPQNLDAERSVLGAMLLDNGCIADVSEVLTPSDFYAPSHQLIYESALELYEQSKPVDFITLGERLQRKDSLESAGGRDYLILLGQALAGAGRAVHHAHLVRDCARLRGLMNECATLAAEAQSFRDEDVDQFLENAEKRIYDVVRSADSRETSSISSLMSEEIKRVESLSDREVRCSGVRSGFSILDDMTFGFQPGDLIILAARPSMGKTALALNMLENAARLSQVAVAFFSLEMSTSQVGRRLLCSLAKVDASKLQKGSLSSAERHRLVDAAGTLAALPMFVDDTPGLSVLSLRSKARRLKAAHDIQFIVVDYLQLMEAPQAESRQVEIAIISRSLKALARELKLPVIALSQLNRSVDSRDDKRPRMSDLRESGAIEQDADVILLLFREEYYGKTEANANKATVDVAKQRNGPTGSVELQFTREFMRFENLAYERGAS